MEYETLTPAICWERIEGIINQNLKRTYAGYIRNVFNYGRNQIPVVMSESKIYDLPSQEDLHKVIESSKYRLYLFLCMYAGLRIGEACAVVPQQVKKEGLVLPKSTDWSCPATSMFNQTISHSQGLE
jgi:integrase